MVERLHHRARQRGACWPANAFLLLSCGPAVESQTPPATDTEVENSSSTSTSASATSETTTSGFTSAAPTASGPDTSVGDSTTSDPSSSWCLSYFNLDLGIDGVCDEVSGVWGANDCTTWYDECPRDMKCDFSGTCVAVPVRPRQMYEACTEGGESPDECDRGLHCRQGVCLGFCQCNEEAPHCADPNSQCLGLSTSRVCYPECDLLDPTCPLNYGCAAAWGVGAFCIPVLGVGSGPPGTSCDGFEDCAPGTACYGDALQDLPSSPTEHSQTRIPGCTSDFKCCAELCQLPDGSCSQPGAICTVFTADETKVPCFGFDTGVCLLPA